MDIDGQPDSISRGAVVKSINLVDYQVPICGISKKCLRAQSNHTPSCDPDDFQCVCKASNSLARNTQFDQQCAFNECYGDIGLREFLHYLAYSCEQVDRTLTDIPERWKFYLPESPTPSPTTILALPSDTSPSSPPPTNPIRLSPGAMAGISIAALSALILVLALGTVYLKAKKKAQDLTRRNAILLDRTSAHGASARIEQVIGRRRSVTSLTTTDGGATLVSRDSAGEGYGREGSGYEAFELGAYRKEG
ncbi:hypothetical protein BKA66DRAFT_611354 [Pyrenochaeta sp. MPI-SDFR-AT-0127]|nr:hypothetical protein BKA66DRAFT_611354 [Pyrenochaeta sp. MPI-SDFR-AT-0127]